MAALDGEAVTACQRCGHDPDARIAARWSFFVDKEVQSLNAHHVNAGAKWQQAIYRRERDEWMLWMQAAKGNQMITRAQAKRRVRLVRMYTGRQRPFDVDNLIGGCKQVVDGMVRAGLLRDDSKQWAEIEYDQEKAGPKERSGLLVFIEELAP